MKSGIYKITNTFNAKFYIGSSKNTDTRWYKHTHDLKKGNHCNQHLQYAYSKYGKEAFSFEVLEICEQDMLVPREQYYIDALKPEYNICPKAGSSLGRKLTDEHKRRIGEANSKKTRTVEEKDRISEFMKTRPVSAKTRTRMGAARLGKKHTDEAKQKMRGPKKNKRIVCR